MNPKKRGLGRGLDALLQTEGSGVREVPLGALQPNRRQPRTAFDEAGIEELAASIRTQGIVQPLIVTPAGNGDDGQYVIVAGERRFRAAQRAGLASVPVVIRPGVDDRELLELALVENLQRSDLNPLEEAEAFQALQADYSLTQEEVALRVGKSRAGIANALRLLKLTPSVQELVRSGALSAGQVRPLLVLDPKRQEELALRAVEKGLSARELERLVASIGKGRKPRPRDPEPNAADAADRLTQRWQTKVEIVRKGPRGSVRLHFDSEEELIRLFDLLMARGGRA